MSVEALRTASQAAGITDPVPAPHPDAIAFVKTWWMRSMLQGYATALATQQMLGFIDPADGEGEIYVAAIAFGRAIQAGPGLIAAAAYEVWRKARERAEAFATDLRWAIWPMGKAQMPGEAIIATAKKINDKYGILLADDDLIMIAGKIAHAAYGKRSRHGRG